MKRSLLVYAVGHLAVDFVCAWAVFGRLSGTAKWLELALVYNFCAFAMQMPVGILADRLGRNRSFGALGAALVCAGALSPWQWPMVILCGAGNALYHVGGGRETLLETEGYQELGLFVAPGAMGIFLGSLFRGETLPGIMGIGLLLACGLLLWMGSRQEMAEPAELQRPDQKELLRTVGMFAVVILRSLVGMCMITPWKTGVWVVLGTILGAFGKAAGGLASDRWGAKVGAGLSLLAAAVLYLFPEQPVCGVLAGFLFNMSMPVTLRDSARALSGGEGFAFGLLTFGLFLGFLPAQWGLTLTSWQGAALAAFSGLILIAVARRNVKCTT